MNSKLFDLIDTLVDRFDNSESNSSRSQSQVKKKSRKIKLFKENDDGLTQPPPVKNGATGEFRKIPSKVQAHKRKPDSNEVAFPLKRPKDDADEAFAMKSYGSGQKNQALLAYNKEITSNFELKSIDQIQEKITEIFTKF